MSTMIGMRACEAIGGVEWPRGCYPLVNGLPTLQQWPDDCGAPTCDDLSDLPERIVVGLQSVRICTQMSYDYLTYDQTDYHACPRFIDGVDLNGFACLAAVEVRPRTTRFVQTFSRGWELTLPGGGFECRLVNAGVAYWRVVFARAYRSWSRSVGTYSGDAATGDCAFGTTPATLAANNYDVTTEDFGDVTLEVSCDGNVWTVNMALAAGLDTIFHGSGPASEIPGDDTPLFCPAGFPGYPDGAFIYDCDGCARVTEFRIDGAPQTRQFVGCNGHLISVDFGIFDGPGDGGIQRLVRRDEERVTKLSMGGGVARITFP